MKFDAGSFRDPSGRVLAMMPHPERHAEALLGGEQGALMFKGLAA